MTEDPGPTAAQAEYRARRDRFGAAADDAARRGLRASRIRAGLFLAAVALFTGADLAEGAPALGLTAAGALSVGLLFLWIRRHRSARQEEERLREIAELNELALSRLHREWDALPEAPAGTGDPSHPYAADLAVTGERSLLRLCTGVTTRPGLDTLRRWLLDPAPVERIGPRQEAVAELAPMVDFRQELAALGRRSGGRDGESVDRLVAWAEDSPEPVPAWLAWAAWGLPPVSLGLLAAHLGGFLGAPWWGLPLVAAWLVSRTRKEELHARMDRVGSGAGRLSRYGNLLARASGLEPTSSLLVRIRRAVRDDEHDVRLELRRLSRRVDWSEARRNGLLHAPLQLFLLWDVHVVRSLEGWRRRVGGRVRAWLEALGRLEALCALATIRADHPDWCVPDVRVGADRLEARELGHPLLPGERRVGNDVEVGPPGTFLFVTGSNMSGKSTLLRAIGLNAVLARAGAPACARSLRLPALRPHTSMRVEESLSEGISYFMAELRRVRGIVEAARRVGDRASPGERVLYLLDEPLQGTNEAERRVAVQTILRHLLRTGAVGAVATHDLRLHDTDLLDEAARPVHLEGTVEEGEAGPVLSFDYRLRPGPATSTNALALLGAVGLGDEDDPPSPDSRGADPEEDRA